MISHQLISWRLPAVLLVLLALPVGAQSFRVQCPTSTITHPSTLHDNNSEPAYVGPTTLVSIYDISEVGTTVTVVGNAPLGVAVGDQVIISGTDTTGYNGTFPITSINVPNPFFPANQAFTYTNPTTGLAEVTMSASATAALPPRIDGHVDPRPIMDVGVMNGNIPAPLMAIDEDDEVFLTLTNAGMTMRPDLFEQHTVHFHGYPNASAS